MNEKQLRIEDIAESFTLPNGLRVCCERLPQLRTVTVGLWLHTGSMHELEAENGLSHFMEHMVFKGTDTRTARQINEEMDAVGGSMNAFTGKDATCFYAKVIDEDLPLAVDLLADLAIHATLDAEELEKERGVILEEIAMDEDSPEDVVTDMLAEVMYTGQSMGRTILGPAEKIAAYTRSDLAAYRSRHYCPRDAVLAVCGNFDTAELRTMAEKYFGSWHNDLPPYASPALNCGSGRLLLRSKDIEQSHICLGWPGLSYTDERLTSLQAASSILGGTMTSRLFQRIREELGAAYSIYTFTNTYEMGGSFGIYAGVNASAVERVLGEIRGEVDRFLRDGITEREFRDTKTQMRAGMLMGLESPGNRMQRLGRSLLLQNRV